MRTVPVVCFLVPLNNLFALSTLEPFSCFDSTWQRLRSYETRPKFFKALSLVPVMVVVVMVMAMVAGGGGNVELLSQLTVLIAVSASILELTLTRNFSVRTILCPPRASWRHRRSRWTTRRGWGSFVGATEFTAVLLPSTVHAQCQIRAQEITLTDTGPGKKRRCNSYSKKQGSTWEGKRKQNCPPEHHKTGSFGISPAFMRPLSLKYCLPYVWKTIFRRYKQALFIFTRSNSP